MSVWDDEPGMLPVLGFRKLPTGWSLTVDGQEVTRMEGPDVVPFVWIRGVESEVYLRDFQKGKIS